MVTVYKLVIITIVLKLSETENKKYITSETLYVVVFSALFKDIFV